MSADTLQSIPSLLANKDAAALVALEDHSDKQVRKAARKAVHTLRAKGVEIPTAAAARSWASGSQDALRGDLRESAAIDVDTTPGLVRLMIAAPQAEERGYLWVASLTGRDMIADFVAYVQTDGQRARMTREWSRVGRSIPTDWARARIRWAREQTLSQGFSVPDQLDSMLVHLGPAPSVRPPSFLTGQLDTGTYRGDRDNVEQALVAARAFQWPPMFDVEPILQRVNTAHPDMSNETPEGERYDALMAAADGDEGLRAALAGPIANLLEDVATNLWLHGVDKLAAESFALASELRAAPNPETLPWIGRLLGFQIASTLAYMQRQQQQQGRA
ncbi:MAG: hypothetical protein JNL82_02145 [Myxococcales bacterium]|nr:hypothetical protein [Myxococcales bacterium]